MFFADLMAVDRNHSEESIFCNVCCLAEIL
jgi:hypothetical protein